MSSNPALAALIAQATKALTGKPAWGKTLCVDFGTDGALYVDATNRVYSIPNDNVAADCTLHLNGITTLNDLLSKKKTPTQEWWAGNLKWDGARSVAETFVALVQGAT